eukprot:2847802-Prymnesium_polylepis.1
MAQGGGVGVGRATAPPHTRLDLPHGAARPTQGAARGARVRQRSLPRALRGVKRVEGNTGSHTHLCRDAGAARASNARPTHATARRTPHIAGVGAEGSSALRARTRARGARPTANRSESRPPEAPPPVHAPTTWCTRRARRAMSAGRARRAACDECRPCTACDRRGGLASTRQPSASPVRQGTKSPA